MAYLVAALTLLCVLSAVHAEVVECTEHSQCSEDAEPHCEGGQCRCPMGFVLVPSKKACYENADNIEGPCEFKEQCQPFADISGAHVDCVKGAEGTVCRCDNGYHFEDGHCWKSVGIGAKCSGKECHVLPNPQRLNCVDNKCTCDAKYPPNEDNTTCGGVTLTSGISLVGLLVAAIISINR